MNEKNLTDLIRYVLFHKNISRTVWANIIVKLLKMTLKNEIMKWF